MGGRILILGAAGRLGRATAEAFRDAGWTVVSLVRPGAGARAVSGTVVVEDDGLHREAVLEAAVGADVVLDALNAPYGEWAKKTLPMVDVAVAAAKAANATLLFPGNIYNYGKAMPELIDEATPMRPTARKGILRVQAEEYLRAAAEHGVRTIVVRAGDFFGGAGRGSWFDLIIARDVALSMVRYPGPLDVVHSWAYLPDLAQTMVKVAAVRQTLAPFETFGFAGHQVTGGQMIEAIQQALGRPLRRKSFPWWAIRGLSPFVSHWRELTEIAYLWDVPHRISGEKLRAVIGEAPKTPFSQAIRTALDPLSR
jgi:nucleoside-diphosphate-sugar epimerase